MPATQETLPPADLKALTSLRFFAAFMIFMFHLQNYDATPWLQAIGGSMRHGVSFFFVLSGFILTHVYSSREKLDPRMFFLSRFARLYPTVLASTALLIILIPLAAAQGQRAGFALGLISFVAKILMLDSLAPIRVVQFSWNDVSWSVSTEFFFYAAFPLLLLNFRRDWASKLAASALILIAVLVGALWLGVPLTEHDNTTMAVLEIGYTHPLTRGFEFVLGMCVYLGWDRWLRPLSLSRGAATAMEGAALVLVAFWLGWGQPWLVARVSGAVWIWVWMAGSCWAFALLIPLFASARGWFGAALSLRPFVWLGEVSFGFYMYHVIVMRWADLHGARWPAVALFALSLGLAALNHRYIEVPCRRLLLARFGKSRARRAELAAAPG